MILCVERRSLLHLWQAQKGWWVAELGKITVCGLRALCIKSCTLTLGVGVLGFLHLGDMDRGQWSTAGAFLQMPI